MSQIMMVDNTKYMIESIDEKIEKVQKNTNEEIQSVRKSITSKMDNKFKKCHKKIDRKTSDINKMIAEMGVSFEKSIIALKDNVDNRFMQPIKCSVEKRNYDGRWELRINGGIYNAYRFRFFAKYVAKKTVKRIRECRRYKYDPKTSKLQRETFYL